MADEVPSIGIILLLVCRCSRHSEKTRKTYRSAKRFEKETSVTQNLSVSRHACLEMLDGKNGEEEENKDIWSAARAD